MLDIKFIRQNPEALKEAARKKHVDFDVEHLLAVDSRRRELLESSESLKAEQNKRSKGPQSPKDLEELKVDKQKYLEDVIEKIKSIEVLKIKVAYHPSEGDIEKIYTFVKKYVELDVLLEITTDPQIMGGAIFMYKGEYRDCSLLKTFNANKNAITTSLESSLSIS